MSENVLEGLNQDTIQETLETLHKQYFTDTNKDMLEDIVNLLQTKEVSEVEKPEYFVYNVNRNVYGEWRGVVIKDGVAIDNIFVDETLKQSFQTVDFEQGEEILWLAVYTDRRRMLLVQTGPEITDFEEITNGEIQNYYKGEDIGYVANFLVSIGDVNTVFGEKETKERFVAVDKQVREFMGKQQHPPVVNFLSTALLSVKDASSHLPTWENAESLEDLETIKYGIELETDDEKFVKEQITRALVWQGATVMSPEGETISDDTQIAMATLMVDEQAVPGITPNSVGNFTVELAIPEHFKAVLLITEDHVSPDGRFRPFKLYARKDFRP